MAKKSNTEKTAPKNETPNDTTAKKKTETSGETLPLIAYRLNNTQMKLVAGPTNRQWMEETPNRFAYRCMPMLLSNQSGWMVECSHDISVIWDGRQALEGLSIHNMSDGGPLPALSIFGSGILTFTLPFLFRTPEGYNLVAQGPTNWPKDGISPLSGVIETDWAESTFTMNWKVTRPNHAIAFTKGEPICMIVPQRRYEIESFDPVIRDISSNPELHQDYTQWANSRKQFNEDLKKKDSDAQKAGWQKHYAQGKTVSEKRSTSHQSKLTLREFVEEKKS